MSATISQPIAGQSNKSAAPFGAVALIAGALALGAVGIALGQGMKAAPAAGAAPADVQAALVAQRMGEKAPLFPARDGRLVQHQGELSDALGAAGTTDGLMIQHQGELRDRAAAAAAAAASGSSNVTSDGRVFQVPSAIPVTPTSTVTSDGRILKLQAEAAHRFVSRSTFRISGAGPKTGAQKGLAPTTVNPYPGKSVDDAAVISDPYAGKAIDDAVTAATSAASLDEWAAREASHYGYSSPVAADRWSVLATNPYAQGLLSQTGRVPVRYATGGVRINHR